MLPGACLISFNPLHASGDFANILDPERQNVSTDMDPNCLTLIVFLKLFLKKLILNKVSRKQQNLATLPSMQ